MNERIKSLRRGLKNNTHYPYRQKPFLGTIIDDKTKHLPLRIRKAYAFSDALNRMPIYIQDEELIIGARTIFNLPEYYLIEELEGARTINNNVKDPIFNNVYNESVDEAGYKIADTNPVHYKKILKNGLSWYVAYAERQMNDDTLLDSQKDYYKGVIITVTAAQNFIRRYVNLIDTYMERDDFSRSRISELHFIKKSLQNIVENPPEDFFQAVQLIYIVWIMLWVEAVTLVPFDRIDQILYPFYKKDFDNNMITYDQALEIIECFFIKINFDIDIPNNRFTWLKGDTGQTITLGGVDPDLPDICGENEVTFICIDALKDLKLPDPHVHIRVNSFTSSRLWDEIIDLVSYGLGIPVIDFDQNIIKALRAVGIYRESDIIDYCGTGCWELIVGGRTSYRQCGNLDLLLPLEWLLHCGNHQQQEQSPNFLIDNSYRGIPFFDLESIDTFEKFKELYFVELKYYISTIVYNVIRTSYGYTPFLSTFVDDCLSLGKDIKEGGARYKETDIQACSLANVADSFWSIENLVFRQNKITLTEFAEILSENYEGKEPLRQEIIQKFPKFGNNIFEVDKFAKEIAEFFSNEVSTYTNGWGGPFRARIAGASSFIDNMNVLKASPDGRKSGDYTSQNASPQLGADTHGPTALMNTITTLDTKLFPGGFILDLKFSKNLFRSSENRNKIKDLLIAFAEKGGMQLQINVVDAEVLRDAQKHPDLHKDLIVRVWGFSAYFVDLPKEFQNHVIKRTEINL